MVYTVTLSPAIDYVLRLPHLDYDDINRADSAELLYGGKGINVSVVLSRLKIPTTALGFTAGFTGKKLRELVTEQGVESEFVELKHGNTRINVKIFADRQFDINAPGAIPDSDETDRLLNRVSALTEKDYIVLAGAVPSSCSGIYETILGITEKKNIKAAVDTTGDDLLNSLKHKPFLIKPNHHELSEIFNTQINGDDEKKIVEYAKKLKDMGAVNVLVSRGKYGATLIDENNNVMSAGIVPGKPVNNVGCGDSTVAGFLAGYIKTGDYREALLTASAAGNASAFCEGVAKAEDINKMKKEYFS